MKILKIPFFNQKEDNTCGPASLEMVFSFFGRDLSESKLKKLAKTTKDNGTSHFGIIQAVRKSNFYCYVHKNSDLHQIKSFISQGFPVIIRYIEPSENEDHYSIVVGFNKNHLFLNDPWNGKRYKISNHKFISRWRDDDYNPLNDRWMMVISKRPFSLGRQYFPIR